MNTTGKTLRVLSVEDSEDDFELIRNELAEGGFTVMHRRVEAAESLKEALECGYWDVVICDHNLPRLDSMSALMIVQTSAKDLPFIIVSGDISDKMAVEAMRHGARDFIRKDNLSRLVPAIKRELRGAKARADLEDIQRRVHRISHFDSLTGLPNCEYLFRHLESMVLHAEHSNPFAVILIDLNRFRKITKTLGVLAGDKVILEMSKRLRRALGEGIFVAHLSTDRFVAVMPHMWQEAQAKEVAAIVHQCMNGAFQIDGQELFVKVCLGVSFYPKDGQQWDELFRNAESALYGAKVDGGSYQAYKPEMDVQGKERLVMETALYHALEEEQFVLHYQPQFDMLSGRVVGTEALIRWRHPELGMVPPDEFISMLEETGLIVPVGEWVLRTACTRNKQWQDTGLPPVCVAVNLSATQFRQPGLPQTIRNVLKETGLLPEYLELEITENIAMHAEEEVISILGELRAIGIQIAIDDFGTGYSSLSYLKRFPIDKLKIDKSFVRDYQEGSSDNGIITAIIGMGHGLKLKVIAEGVETQAQADFLKLRGCDEVQGYFYGRPMEDSDFASLMVKAAYPNKQPCKAMA